MQQRVVLALAAILFLSLLLLTEAYPHAAVKVQEGTSGQKDIKDSRWFMNQLPPMIYNLCALYYVSPESLDNLFGEEFDVTSMVAEICPS